MSRYLNVDKSVYVDPSGNQFELYDLRDILEEQVSFEVDVGENDLLDEVASRPDVFGEYGEAESYRLFDMNIVELTERNFDMSKIKKLKVPV